MIDSLFGSKTRVKLLHLFLNNPEKSFYVREITRMVDEQINSVRRELANMLAVGVILSDGVDNKLYYMVNPDYEYIEPLSAIFSDKGKDPAKETSDKVSSKSSWAELIKKIAGLRLAVISGGLVQGSASKIDLLLVGDTSPLIVKRLIKKIEKDENRELSYTVMAFDDFYYRLSVRDRFIMDIISNKHSVLVDTDDLLRKERE